MHNVTNTTTSELECSKPRLAHGGTISRNDHLPSAFSEGGTNPSTESVQRNDIVSSLFLKAFLGLLVFDVFGFGQNFAKMHRFISNWKVSATEAQEKTVNDVCTAVNYACAWYPKRALCLQRSAVTTCLLRRCGIPATMVMGVQSVPFKAHAWTEVNNAAVNERRDVQKYYTAWERC